MGGQDRFFDGGVFVTPVQPCRLGALKNAIDFLFGSGTTRRLAS
jgi:hypothetical protein